MLTQPGLLPRLCSLALAVFSTSILFAQTPTGTVSGTVQDASGAVVPNAVILMTHKETGSQRNLLTTMDGTYTVAALPPGTYQVKTSMKGFRTVVREATVET